MIVVKFRCFLISSIVIDIKVNFYIGDWNVSSLPSGSIWMQLPGRLPIVNSDNLFWTLNQQKFYSRSAHEDSSMITVWLNRSILKVVSNRLLTTQVIASWSKLHNGTNNSAHDHLHGHPVFYCQCHTNNQCDWLKILHQWWKAILRQRSDLTLLWILLTKFRCCISTCRRWSFGWYWTMSTWCTIDAETWCQFNSSLSRQRHSRSFWMHECFCQCWNLSLDWSRLLQNIHQFGRWLERFNDTTWQTSMVNHHGLRTSRIVSELLWTTFNNMTTPQDFS